jgi:4-hydroxybenzoate polyprenyltransferase
MNSHSASVTSGTSWNVATPDGEDVGTIKALDPIEAAAPASVIPLVVDLDGTLIRSDLLMESAFAKLGRDPSALLGLARALAGGKAELKAFCAQDYKLDPSCLPYDPAVLALIQTAKSEGRPVYLVSGSNEDLVGPVADHLGLFDGWSGSTRSENLTAKRKAKRLIERFGERGFDYVGNDRDDLAVWKHARACYGIRMPASVANRLAAVAADPVKLASDSPQFSQWVKLLRVHQYAKNVLVFVPIITAHLFSYDALFAGLLAFIAFSLCASSVYIVNDLVDLQSDRRHPTKRLRPLASGALPQKTAVLLAAALLAAAAAIAFLISWPFAVTLGGYFLLTTAYTFALKRKMLVDVVTLSLLYIVRVVAGAVAVSIFISEWLLAFSMFIFTALALIKRYVELTHRLDRGLNDSFNRNYRIGDIDVIAALIAAAGFNAVTVFSLYIASDSVKELYSHPQALWLVCPLLMYWIGRALLMAHRRHMDDDPIVFALKDRPSLIVLGLVCLIVLAAM